jgi:hypothetical protein
VNDDFRRRNRHAIPLIRVIFEAPLDIDVIADPDVLLGELRLKIPQRQPVPIGTVFLIAVGGLPAVCGE